MKSKFYGEINPELIEKIQAYSDKMKAIIDSGNYDTENPSDEFYTGYAFGDRNVIERIKSDVRGAYMYPNSITELKARTDECIEFFRRKK